MPETMRVERDGEWQRRYDAVARAIAFIRANAARQPELAEVAAAAQLSEFHLQRLFSAWAGLSPKRFLQYLTKEHARAALRASAGVLDAALDAGLSGPGRLHDLMVSCEALTPGEIRAGGAGRRTAPRFRRHAAGRGAVRLDTARPLSSCLLSTPIA
jgi:methylphosphotriester-DNA--protein-cysteine methyltransferase